MYTVFPVDPINHSATICGPNSEHIVNDPNCQLIYIIRVLSELLNSRIDRYVVPPTVPPYLSMWGCQFALINKQTKLIIDQFRYFSQILVSRCN